MQAPEERRRDALRSSERHAQHAGAAVDIYAHDVFPFLRGLLFARRGIELKLSAVGEHTWQLHLPGFMHARAILRVTSSATSQPDLSSCHLGIS